MFSPIGITMHYTDVRTGCPVVSNTPRRTLASRIQEEVISDFPTHPWRFANDPCPLQYDTDSCTLVSICLPFCDATPRTNAVYVLECMKNKRYRQTAATRLGKLKPQWDASICDADRILYVGMTVNLLRRLNEHLNHPERKAADFTAVFRPIRLLSVTWYSSISEAARAEPLTASLLRDAFPSNYVSQPG